MKEKKLPAFVTNPMVYRFFQGKPGRLLSNWVLQGMLYMNPVEIFYKLGLDIILALVWWFVIGKPVTPGGWLLAGLLAHTTNWIINCQPIALRRHLDWGRNDPVKFIEYIEGLERRIQGRKYIAAAASFGSLSHGNYSDTSDIDIRFFLTNSKIERIHAAHFCFVERFRAALCRFPLDLYAFELDEMKVKMSNKEVPVIFMDPHGIIARAYRKTVAFDDFRHMFRKKVLGEEVV